MCPSLCQVSARSSARCILRQLRCLTNIRTMTRRTYHWESMIALYKICEPWCWNIYEHESLQHWLPIPIQNMLHVWSMVLEYESLQFTGPEKHGWNVGIHIPAPWFASGYAYQWRFRHQNRYVKPTTGEDPVGMGKLPSKDVSTSYDWGRTLGILGRQKVQVTWVNETLRLS